MRLRCRGFLAGGSRPMKSHARVVVIGGGVVGVCDALPPRPQGLVGRGPVRADRAHRRFHLARGGPPAPFQHELQRRADPQVFGAALSGARARDGTGRRLPPGRQHPPRHEPRPHGRVPVLCRGRAHHRGPRRVPDPRRGPVDLAALQRGGARRCHRASRGRLHPACGPHPGVRARRPRPGGGDPPAYEGDRHRADGGRGVAGTNRPG